MPPFTAAVPAMLLLLSVLGDGVTVGLARGCLLAIDTCPPLFGLVLPQLRFGFGHWF